MNIEDKQSSYKKAKEDLIENLLLKHFGQCPKYKGHFDIHSFFVGLTIGIMSIPTIGLIARLFK